jgi:hypothetical protein
MSTLDEELALVNRIDSLIPTFRQFTDELMTAVNEQHIEAILAELRAAAIATRAFRDELARTRYGEASATVFSDVELDIRVAVAIFHFIVMPRPLSGPEQTTRRWDMYDADGMVVPPPVDRGSAYFHKDEPDQARNAWRILCPHYSTSMSDAWKVVIAMRALDPTWLADVDLLSFSEGDACRTICGVALATVSQRVDPTQ